MGEHERGCSSIAYCSAVGTSIAEPHAGTWMLVRLVVERQIAVCVVKERHIDESVTFVCNELIKKNLHHLFVRVHCDCRCAGRGERFVVDICRHDREHV